MKVETLFEKLDQFVDAPSAVSKMRELILQMAIQGKLVAQVKADIPALDTLRKSSRAVVPLSVMGSMAIPYGWASIPLGCAIATNVGGGTPAKHNASYWNGSIPWASVKDIRADKYILETMDSITEEGLRNSSSNLIPVNRLIVVTRMGLGKLAINKIPVAINQDLRAIEPNESLDLDFAYLLFKSLKLVGKGVTVKGITLPELHAISIGLPPVAEQKRIVVKVNELMALCDRLEKQQNEHLIRHAALTCAAVARFNEDPTEDNLNLLFHKSYSISPADLRRAITSLALRGKLVPRGEYGESVDLLLAKLQEERHRYAKKYGFRTNDPRKDKADMSYSIPNHWRWVNLSDLFYAVTDGDHLPPPKASDGIAFLTIGNITTGQLDFSEVRYVPKHYYDALAEYRQPRSGDFLYTVVGATYGRLAPVDTTRPFCVQRHIAILKPCQSTSREFLSLLLKSPQVYEQAKASTTGTAQPTIPLGALRNFRVPLPPISEQDEIARKVSDLLALVDTMNEQLRKTEGASEKLLDVFIHLVLHPDEEVANSHTHDNASSRAAIGCYAIGSLKQNASFGRTMLMKVFYLSEAHAGISQGWQPMRQAAGPYDAAIADFESLGIQSGWFTVKTKTLSNGHEMVQYQSKSGMEAKIAEAVSVLGGQQTEFDRLLDLFQNKTTEEAEIIATLFAAWNDLLIDGKSPSDDQIIREVRENWHYKKERFTPTLLSRWLNWLRQQRVIPRGLAPRTRQQLKLGLS